MTRAEKHGTIYPELEEKLKRKPSEYKRRKGGDLKPNATENWLDVQTRALYQAEMMIKEVMK